MNCRTVVKMDNYFQLLNEAIDKQYYYFISGRNCGKIEFINEMYRLKTGRRVTPMTQQEFSYYTEVTQQRVESLHDGAKLREDVLVDTIYRLSDMVEYLQKGEQRPKGHWIDSEILGEFQCSCCKKYWQDSEDTEYSDWIHMANFCPVCGADMKGVNNEKSTE